MKIGILTHYFGSENYGGNLQAYALCRILNELGYEAEQISLDRSKDKGLKYNIKKIARKILKPQIRNARNFKIRRKAILSFNKEFIPHSRTYSEKTVNTCVDEYDAFITGSDQVWHPNAVCDAYLLKFAPSEKIKISYSASIAHNELSVANQARYESAFFDYKAISVREEEAVDLVSPLTDKKVEVTLDPTLLLNKEEWLEIASPAEIYEKYLFCYFLGDDGTERKLACDYAKKHGLKIVTLPHLAGKFRKCDEKFGDYLLYDVSPLRFIGLINEAECIFTDSFHAAVFSSICKKEHFIFQRSGFKAMNSRIHTLTALFGTKEHFCDTEEKQSIEYIESCEKIKFDNTDELVKVKEASIGFLTENLVKENKNHIVLNNKQNCSGCHACVSACPRKCISMKRDTEGFLYPKINEDLCIMCGLCLKTCPILAPQETKRNENDIVAYSAYNKNEKVRKESSSGGVFTLIAEYVINQGGVVFGAAFNEDFTVSHKFADTVDKLSMFRGSKYVQSTIGNAYCEAKAFLESGKLVLFTGTPCQIEGLNAFLNKNYENLITQDIVCHGVPSPTVFKKYLEAREKENQSIAQGVVFRDKRTGWKTYSVSINFANGTEYLKKSSSDSMMRAFIGNLCLRPSCYACSFKSKVRNSDITLADFWGVNKILPHMDDDRGTSLVVVNSVKGGKIFESISKDLVVEKTNLDEVVKYNVSMIKSSPKPNGRDAFMVEIKNGDFAKTVEKNLVKKTFFRRVFLKIKKLFKSK